MVKIGTTIGTSNMLAPTFTITLFIDRTFPCYILERFHGLPKATELQWSRNLNTDLSGSEASPCHNQWEHNETAGKMSS